MNYRILETAKSQVKC